jgi:integrase
VQHLSQESLKCEKLQVIYPARRALSSAVEHFLHTEGVAGSKPAARTIFPMENGKSAFRPKEAQNISEGFVEQTKVNVKFPKRLRYRDRGKILATIYKSDHPSQPYTLYWRVRVDGKPRSRFKSFSNYSAAKKKGDSIVADLATGRLAATLSPGQVTDALGAIERLRNFFVATGRKVSLLGAVSEFADSATALNGNGSSLAEAVKGYLSTVATLDRKDLSVAVEDFVKLEQPRTLATAGQRAQLGQGYAKQKAKMLREFAALFPGHAVCDLNKAFLDTFMTHIREREHRPAISPKSRNHHRTVLKQFLNWATSNDYLLRTHRLFEADSMRPEKTNGWETEFYTAKELGQLLQAAEGSMQALIAIGGLAGLRTAELLRLDWVDVWRLHGHIEITAGKSKTRQRRLVKIVPALAAWLRPFAKLKTGPLWQVGEHKFHKHFGKLCERTEVDRKQNALRHSFCTYHFALHANENLTSQQAGNSPSMIHAHYKGLATKAEAKQWFGIRPAKPAKNVVSFPVQTKKSA